MIRVLYCIEAMVHGGTEKQLAALVRGLDRRRVQPLVCTLKPSSMSLAELGCPSIELRFRTFRSPSALGCLGRLRGFINEHRVDVVQTFFQDPTLLGWLASVRTGVRARVASFRDMGFWRTPAKVAQLRLVYPWFDGFIANSAVVARAASEQDGIPLEKIEVILNGVVAPPARPVEAPSRGRVVGIVANLDRQVKRVDLFLQAAQKVRAAVPDVEFVVVGDGHLRPDLSALADRLGIAPNVRFEGSVKNPWEQIQRFDVGVISSDSEGLSNAILEYMAAGIPTVARRVGGNTEAVIDGETGFLVGDSPDDLARGVVRLLREDGMRESMAKRSVEEAASRFSLDACVRRHDEYYHRLLESADRRLEAGKAAS